MRQKTIVQISRNQLFALHQQFKTSVSLLSGNHQLDAYSNYLSLHAFGVREMVVLSAGNALSQLQCLVTENADWLFGVLGYDLKNEVEELESKNFDGLACPDVIFFVPEFVVAETSEGFELLADEGGHKKFLSLVDELQPTERFEQEVSFTPRISKAEYHQAFESIQHHIATGDFYEMNYCQEFFQEGVAVDMLSLFLQKIEQVSSPFMGFFQHEDWQMVSFSPERYLAKRGNTLISQPIKGTAKRGETKEEDELRKENLLASLKERTENTMIVDLVRNDLGKCAKPGKVMVSEYLKLYTYPNIHQLVSTIEAEQQDGLSFSDIIRNTYPMGSMTGAPKLKVMEVTEQLEQSKRGWYSGALGYIAPTGDFDFNVIIRSLIFNQDKQYLSCHVGGGITSFSTGEEEYEECLTKLRSVVG